MRYLLDTNIVIAFLDPRRRSPVARRLTAQAPRSVVTSVIVAHELYFGAANSSRPDENRRRLDAVLAELSPLPLTPADARAGGSSGHS
jgi:tRNA(fMet)-specific endonuclease VapC